MLVEFGEAVLGQAASRPGASPAGGLGDVVADESEGRGSSTHAAARDEAAGVGAVALLLLSEGSPGTGPPAGAHLDENALALLDFATPAERAAMRSHLAGCAACRRFVGRVLGKRGERRRLAGRARVAAAAPADPRGSRPAPVPSHRPADTPELEAATPAAPEEDELVVCYSRLLQIHQDPNAPEVRAFREAHSRDEAFLRRASLLDEMHALKSVHLHGE
jgi:hypothetical protein